MEHAMAGLSACQPISLAPKLTEVGESAPGTVGVGMVEGASEEESSGTSA